MFFKGRDVVMSVHSENIRTSRCEEVAKVWWIMRRDGEVLAEVKRKCEREQLRQTLREQFWLPHQSSRVHHSTSAHSCQQLAAEAGGITCMQGFKAHIKVMVLVH